MIPKLEPLEETVSEKLAVAVCEPAGLLSWTVTLTLEEPLEVAFPVMAPVESIVKPEGKPVAEYVKVPNPLTTGRRSA